MTDLTEVPDLRNSTLLPGCVGRRRMLRFGLGLAALAIAPAHNALAALPSTGTRKIGFVNTHTDEKILVTYWRDGGYDRGALKDIVGLG